MRVDFLGFCSTSVGTTDPQTAGNAGPQKLGDEQDWGVRLPRAGWVVGVADNERRVAGRVPARLIRARRR